MKIKLVSAALLALLACSCTEEFNDKNGVDGTNTMQVNAYIGKSPVTRAEKTAWENNDQLGVYVVDNSIDVPYKGSESYSNIPFVFTGKGFKSDNILLDENEGTVYAYYPYKSDLADPKAVPVDISEQTDHLYGEGNSKVSITARNVDIEMQHALTQVVFKIRKTSDYKGGEGKITAVVLKNTGAAKPLQIKGSYNIATGAVTTTQDGDVSFSANQTLTEDYVSLSSILFPVSATSGKDMQVVFTIDGRDLKYDFPAGTAWAASYRNIYSISLDGNGLIIGGGEDPSGGQSGVTIEPWTDSQNNDISLVPVI